MIHKKRRLKLQKKRKDGKEYKKAKNRKNA